MNSLLPGVQFIQRHGVPGRGDDARVAAFEFSWFMYTTGMRYDANFVAHVPCVAGNAVGLDFRVKAGLQFWIVGGDPCGASILVAFQRLDTAQREHETARGNDKIRANAQRPGNTDGRNHLA